MRASDGKGGPLSGAPGPRDPGRMTGASFGHYRIVGPLGIGGMGEVWRAEDTRLGREVALKVLPAALADDPERMARFTREARVLASVNHTNVAALYGLEHLSLRPPPQPEDVAAPREPSEPVHVLVMELVEGEGLEEIIARGPLPFAEAAAIGLQICRGLQAAHECGVVHRDLKPANVKVRGDGVVKVLDFGLATSRPEEMPDTAVSQGLTTTKNYPTALGVVLGTAGYMSPEQARGRPVDRRADIWAFGALLYEMLTAAKAFRGETLSDTVAAVLKDEPDWAALPADLEPVAQHVLRRCLAKEPSRRFHHIADVRIELEEAVAVAAPHGDRRRRKSKPAGRVLLAGGAVAVAAVAVIATLRAPPDRPLPTFRALSFRSARVAGARFTPDGHSVVYATSTSQRSLALMSTRTDSIESSPLDLPSADILGIASDGRMALLLDRHCEGSWVSVGTLASADLAGGAARPILERVNGGDISRDGTRVAVVRELPTTQRLEYPLGHTVFETRGWISHMRISPDGERVAFLHHPFYGDDRGLVAMVDRSGTLTRLTRELSDSVQGLAWAPDGRSVWFSVFVFGQGGVVWKVRPGEEPVERLRSPVSVRIQDIASDGRVLLVAGDTRAEIAGRLAGQDEERSYEGWNDDSVGGLSADGRVIAGNIQVATVDGEYTAFSRSSDGSTPVRLGYGDVFGVSPHGRWVFARRMTSKLNSLLMLPTGPGESRTIDLGDVRPDSSSSSMLTCSLDGRYASFAGLAGEGGPRIYVLDVAQGTIRAVGPEGIRSPVMAPDGSRVACLGPDDAITVYAVPSGAAHRVPGTVPGERPLQWSRDGRALLVWNRVFPARIHQVDADHGSRRLALEIMPRNPAGVLYGQIFLTPGGTSYVYRFRRDVSTLFLVEGLR